MQEEKCSASPLLDGTTANTMPDFVHEFNTYLDMRATKIAVGSLPLPCSYDVHTGHCSGRISWILLKALGNRTGLMMSCLLQEEFWNAYNRGVDLTWGLSVRSMTHVRWQGIDLVVNQKRDEHVKSPRNQVALYPAPPSATICPPSGKPGKCKVWCLRWTMTVLRMIRTGFLGAALE